MYAIIEIAGKQFRVEKGSEIVAPKIDGNEGDKIDFDKVLLLSANRTVQVGTPFVDGAKVTAKIEGHGKDKKIIVFKKKRRKGYKVKRGHRQDHTRITIQKIVPA